MSATVTSMPSSMSLPQGGLPAALFGLTTDDALAILHHFRPPPPPSLLEWTLQHRAIDGIPFSLARYPCMEAIYNDESNHIVVVKPNQVGASEWLLNVCLHAMDAGAAYFDIQHIKKSLNVGYVFPNWEQLKDFSKERIRKVAGESPYLTDLLGPAQIGRLKRESDLGLYFVRNCAWYLRGAHNPDTQLASFPVDLLILDEYDLMSPRAATLAEKRLRASPLRWRRYVSKPTLPGFGIDALYKESTRQQWQVRCSSCADWQPLDFWANVALVEPGKIEYHADWSRRDKSDLERAEFACVCRRCGEPIDRLGPGMWQAESPGALIQGYAIPGLAAPFVPLSELVKGSLHEEPDLLLEWYRADLGMAKSPEGGQLSIDDLEACKEDYQMARAGRRCTMGVDVGVHLHCRVGCYQQGEWRTLWLGERDEFDELDELMRRYDVRSAVIDAEPETRMARDFCNRWKGRAWMADYVHPTAPPKAVFEWREAEGDEAARVKVARTEAMDRVSSGYLERRESLPSDARHVPGFYAHLCAPVRVATKRKKSDGTQYTTYIYMESGPDHYFHASVYELAARERLPTTSIQTQGVSGSAY